MYSSLTLRPSARGWAKRMWCASLGVRPHTTQGWVVTYLQCSLSRSRIAWRRHGAGGPQALRQNDRGRRRSIHRFSESSSSEGRRYHPLRDYLSFGGGWQRPRLSRALAETGVYAVRVGGRQGVLDRKVLVNPVRGLIRRLKLIKVGDQLVAQRRRFLSAQAALAGRGAGSLRALLALTAGLSFAGTRSAG